MASAIINKAFETADKIAVVQQCYVVDIEYVKEGNNKILRIYIDNENGVGIDECEKFSLAFDESFDEYDIIKEAYILEVSSPGVDRMLKTEREFNHYIGHKVDVKLYKAIDGKKEFEAVLAGYKDNNAIVKINDNEIEIPVNEAVFIRLHFEV